jgi:periplasmic copper chaperone A
VTRRCGEALPTALALAGTLVLGACSGSSGPELETNGAYVPEPVTEKMAGGYLTVTNSGDEPDKLTSVTSDLSEEVTLHQTVGNSMKRVTSFDIPANGQLELIRGGNHLMFTDLRWKPGEGDRVSLKLRFEKSGPIRFDVPVEAKNYTP